MIDLPNNLKRLSLENFTIDKLPQNLKILILTYYLYDYFEYNELEEDDCEFD